MSIVSNQKILRINFLKDLLERSMKVDRKTVTRIDVAKYANVSVGTVSNVLNNTAFVKKDLVKRVKNAVKELGYIQNYAAKSLASKNNHHIGVAIYETTNPYHLEVVQGIEEYATENGYIVSIFMLNNNMEKKLDAVCKRNLSGIVNFITNVYPESFLEILKRQGTVLVNFGIENSLQSVINYSKAIKEFCSILKENNHKNVGYIFNSDKDRFFADDRCKTFYNIRKEMGFSENDDYIYLTEEYNEKSQVLGYKLAKKMFTQHPEITAVFCTNDMSAIGAIKALNELGFLVPHDVSVIGCDDIWPSIFITPSLCSISFDKNQYGRDIAKTIIDSIKNKKITEKYINATANIVLRDSIGVARKI